MSCLREVQTISKSPDILPMPSLTRLTTGGVLNPLKNTTNTSHNELLHQDPLQPPLEPRTAVPVGGGRARAGLEIDTSEPQARVWRSRGRAAAHRHTQRPGPQSRTGRVGGRPRRSPAQQAPGYAKGAGTEVPAPHSATASSRLRPNDRQSWRRRRIHRNMPPTTAAPRPAPPIRPSKPVRARR